MRLLNTESSHFLLPENCAGWTEGRVIQSLCCLTLPSVSSISFSKLRCIKFRMSSEDRRAKSIKWEDLHANTKCVIRATVAGDRAHSRDVHLFVNRRRSLEIVASASLMYYRMRALIHERVGGKGVDSGLDPVCMAMVGVCYGSGRLVAAFALNGPR